MVSASWFRSDSLHILFPEDASYYSHSSPNNFPLHIHTCIKSEKVLNPKPRKSTSYYIEASAVH